MQFGKPHLSGGAALKAGASLQAREDGFRTLAGQGSRGRTVGFGFAGHKVRVDRPAGMTPAIASWGSRSERGVVSQW